MDVSLKEIAIFAGIGVACLTILVACADWGRQGNKGLQAASDSRHPHRRSRMAGVETKMKINCWPPVAAQFQEVATHLNIKASHFQPLARACTDFQKSGRQRSR
jgi:hypothetical protein